MDMTADLEILRNVEQFLFLEADCLDRHAYDEWLDLWDDDPLYWVPCNDDDTDPGERISLIYERRQQIEQRIRRLAGKHAHAQDPKSRLMRVVSNVRIHESTEAQVLAASAFVLGEIRRDRQVVWFGRNLHTLTRHGDGFRMKQKKVLLLNNDSPMGNLQFLI
jgi:3-phenylpropionate/cinnamic acid dioxygenase small subunit